MRKTCRNCKGRGKITSPMPLPMQVICTRCNGTGIVSLPEHVERKIIARRKKRPEDKQ